MGSIPRIVKISLLKIIILFSNFFLNYFYFSIEKFLNLRFSNNYLFVNKSSIYISH